MVKINYYGVLYAVGDKDLIRYFWHWYRSHKVKSKHRAARCVLLKYYSTTAIPTPDIVYQAFSFKNKVRICKENVWQ